MDYWIDGVVEEPFIQQSIDPSIQQSINPLIQ